MSTKSIRQEIFYKAKAWSWLGSVNGPDDSSAVGDSSPPLPSSTIHLAAREPNAFALPKDRLLNPAATMQCVSGSQRPVPPFPIVLWIFPRLLFLGKITCYYTVSEPLDGYARSRRCCAEQKKRRDASLAVWGKASEETFSFSSLLWIFP